MATGVPVSFVISAVPRPAPPLTAIGCMSEPPAVRPARFGFLKTNLVRGRVRVRDQVQFQG